MDAHVVVAVDDAVAVAVLWKIFFLLQLNLLSLFFLHTAGALMTVLLRNHATYLSVFVHVSLYGAGGAVGVARASAIG